MKADTAHKSGLWRVPFVLAFRNIGRNRRRSIISAASVAFAVLFSTLLQSVQSGVWDNVMDSAIHMQTGYLQLQHRDQQQDPGPDNSFNPAEVAFSRDGIAFVLPRITSFALGSGEHKTRGLMLIGTDFALEDQFSGLRKKLHSGTWPGDVNGVLLGVGAAKYLNLKPGDTLVCLGQGFRGASAVGLFPITGLLDFRISEINDRIVYLPLPLADTFLQLENRVTHIIIEPENPSGYKKLKQKLEASISDSNVVVKDWQDLMPELLEARSIDDGGTRLIQFILYALVTFGMAGTMLMMLRERAFEHAILLSIGTKRSLLGAVLWIETVLLSFFGAIGGMMLAAGPILWFHLNPFQLTGEMAKAYETFGIEPVILASIEPGVFLWQALTIFGISLLLSAYPVRSVYKLSPVKEMHR
jgi:ABC-type lipoprotein release transport system permease subunit